MAEPADMLALTLARSRRDRRVQLAEQKLRQLQRLHEETAQLQQRAQQLRAQLPAAGPQPEAGPAAADRPLPAALRQSAALAVSRQLGVWVVAGAETSAGRQLTVRLQPERAGVVYTLQLLEAASTGQLRVTSHQLPAGTRLSQLLSQHGTAAALVHAVAREVHAHASRRRQVADLLRMLPKRSGLWHDPSCCDVQLSLVIITDSGQRIAVEVQLLYAPDGQLPVSAQLRGVHGKLDDAGRQDLTDTISIFLRLPLAEAFNKGF